MAGDDRTAEERERDAEIGRRLQEELPGYRARFEPDPDPEPEDEDETDDGEAPAPTLFRPLYQEGGCLDPGCWPDFIVVPALLLWHLGRGIARLLGAGRRRFRDHRDDWRRARGWEPWTPPAAMAGRPLRAPAAWADAQRAFRAAYHADPEALPRRRVLVAHADLVTVRATDGRTPGSMVFAPVDATDGPIWAGEVDAVLVGELGTNATACVEAAGGVLWPAYNPVGR